MFRVAKRRFDDYNFYGGSLHICYAPEFESVADVRDKFELRRKETDRQLRRYQDDTSEFVSRPILVPFIIGFCNSERLKAETGANRQSTLDQKPLPKKCITEPFVESTNYSADLPGCSNWIPTMLPSLPVRVGTVRGRDAVAQALWQHSALERNSLTQTESNSAEKLSPPEESTLKQQKKRRNADKTNETWWAEKQKWKEKYRQQLRLIVDKCKTSQKDHEANQPEISKGLPISFVSSKAIDFCSPPPRRTLKFVPITKLNEITFDTQQND